MIWNTNNMAVGLIRLGRPIIPLTLVRAGHWAARGRKNRYNQPMDQRFTEGVIDRKEYSPLDRVDDPGDIQPPVAASLGFLVEDRLRTVLETGANRGTPN